MANTTAFNVLLREIKEKENYLVTQKAKLKDKKQSYDTQLEQVKTQETEIHSLYEALQRLGWSAKSYKPDNLNGGLQCRCPNKPHCGHPIPRGLEDEIRTQEAIQQADNY